MTNRFRRHIKTCRDGAIAGPCAAAGRAGGRSSMFIGDLGLEAGRQRPMGASNPTPPAGTCTPPKRTYSSTRSRASRRPRVSIKTRPRTTRWSCAPSGQFDRFQSLVRAFPSSAFLLGFTSVNWRETWKYGERAFRYCQHDVGHALGSARIAAQMLGWRMLLLDGASDRTVASLLGVDRRGDYEGAEREHPDCLAVLWSADEASSLAAPQAVWALCRSSSTPMRRRIGRHASGTARPID